MYSVHDWAEVRRLFHRQQLSKTEIAERLEMSRNTVAFLLSKEQPPRYERKPKGSKLDPFTDAIDAMLDEDPRVAATVVREHLVRLGYDGGITILKEHLAEVRPRFVAAKSYQRTSYLPGEIGQADWWHTGLKVPVGKGATREALGLVTTLPHSDAHAVVFSFTKTSTDFCAGMLGCLSRLGGVPQGVVVDNDTSIVAERAGGRARVHDEVGSLFGQLGIKPIVLPPRRPEPKGNVERTIRYLETSFLPLRRPNTLEHLQREADVWAHDVAYKRSPRRIGATVAEAWRVERGFLGALPDPLPEAVSHLEVRISKDGFVRVAGADYSVPPGLQWRRAQVAVNATTVAIYCEGRQIAAHQRSFVPADVVIDAAHVRALRLAREARAALQTGDVELEEVDLGAYDALASAQ